MKKFKEDPTTGTFQWRKGERERKRTMKIKTMRLVISKVNNCLVAVLYSVGSDHLFEFVKAWSMQLLNNAIYRLSLKQPCIHHWKTWTFSNPKCHAHHGKLNAYPVLILINRNNNRINKKIYFYNYVWWPNYRFLICKPKCFFHFIKFSLSEQR